MFKAKRRGALLCGAAVLLSVCGTVSAETGIVIAADQVEITTAGGWFESAYAEWKPVSGAGGYNVYADGNRIDSMLIRQYSGYYRADAVGLKAGSHTIKIVPVMNGSEDGSKAAQQTVTVSANDRTGFAWVGGTASGAYNEDGTLRSGAVVLYVTEQTKNTVQMDVTIDSKGNVSFETGIQNIFTALQKGYETRPIDVRCIGNITDPAVLQSGDLVLKGSGATKRLSCGMTIEGIGKDTVFNGFGLRLLNTSNVEVRNIGFMNCNSSEGDDIGLQQNNDHVWVHHCDLFYGDAGSDADQVKGDGALDTKTSSYITHSYNHFWDNGKCNLQGMKSESTENYITYHHNWYDHSDSRHPRIRTCSVHIYNNYFDGNAKYGVGVTMGASAFVESNYFRNCPKPMMSSMQGSDASGAGTFSGEDGGIIKAYNNVMTNQKSYITYAQNSTSFDAYEVAGLAQTVPSNVKTLQGGTAYNNFDTSSVMYRWQADAPADIPTIVPQKAGRVQGGDFKWQFNNAVDDASYAVNDGLKAALVNYKTSIVAIGSGSYVGPVDPPAQTDAPAVTTTQQPQNPDTQTTQPIVLPASEYVHNFTVNGTSSNFFRITGNLSTGKGSMNYAGLTLTQCLKMESSTSIAFDTAFDAELTLVIKDGTTFKVDGNTYDIPAGGAALVTLLAGSHTVAKGSGSSNLFYMAVTPADVHLPFTTTVPATTAAPIVTTTSESVQTTVPTVTRMTGDVNCDGEVELRDAVLLAKMAAGVEVGVTAQGRINAECDGENGITSGDLAVLLTYLAGSITEFPV